MITKHLFRFLWTHRLLCLLRLDHSCCYISAAGPVASEPEPADSGAAQRWPAVPELQHVCRADQPQLGHQGLHLRLWISRGWPRVDGRVRGEFHWKWKKSARKEELYDSIRYYVFHKGLSNNGPLDTLVQWWCKRACYAALSLQCSVSPLLYIV